MAVKVHGVNALISDLESRFGQTKMDSIVDSALTKGTLVFAMELRRQLATFKDEGYTLEEMTISPPDGTAAGRSVRVYWHGPHNRYRIIHLNEWGTIRNPSPRGKGKIAKAMQISKRAYGKAIRDEIRRSI